MKEKTLSERYKDEVLTDNSKFSFYEQCKDCKFRDDGTIYSSDYRKGFCQKYPFPNIKPDGVMKNKIKCKHKDEK